MGGYGSGRRWGGNTTKVEDASCLNVNRMVKLDVIAEDRYKWGRWVWSSVRTGKETSSIGYRLDTTDMNDPHIRLEYMLTNQDIKMDYVVKLSRSKQKLGGYRWWFICPVSGRRVAKLYLPYGARYFAARQVYNLKYESQSEDYRHRHLRKLWKVKDKIGGELAPLRPKGMHKRTFDRLIDKYCHLDEISWMHIHEMLGKRGLLENAGMKNLY